MTVEACGGGCLASNKWKQNILGKAIYQSVSEVIWQWRSLHWVQIHFEGVVHLLIWLCTHSITRLEISWYQNSRLFSESPIDSWSGIFFLPHTASKYYQHRRARMSSSVLFIMISSALVPHLSSPSRDGERPLWPLCWPSTALMAHLQPHRLTDKASILNKLDL